MSSIARAEARNFGLDDLPPHGERYDRADEFMEVCYRLWDSWDEDALLMDMERGIFADPDKLHRLDFEGRWHRCQGPLNVIPSPQRRPFLFQAGQSERGREFAARHAECVFAAGASAEGMRAFCEDLDSRVERHGRRRGAVQVLWLAQPLVAASESEALERYEEIRERIPLEASLSLMSGHFGYDLSKLDLDKPVGDLQVPGTQGALDVYVQNKPDVTLREIASTYLSGSADSPMVGTPKQVADHMIHLIEDGGGHGFQITPAYYAPDYYADLVRLLIPELQARGVYWRDYEGATLRDYMNAL